MKELTLFEEAIQQIKPTPEWYKAADDFCLMVNKKPSPKAIKVNKYANNSQYVEIGYMEMKLDQITKGLWNTEVLDTKLIGNSICVTVRVRFFHWHFKAWLHRDGVGACPIELKATKYRKDGTVEEQGAAHALDFEKLQSRAIQKNLPVAKSEAFKNACKSIGNLFGRHLNREFQHEYVGESQMEQFLNS